MSVHLPMLAVSVLTVSMLAGCGASSSGANEPKAPPTRPLIVEHKGGAPDALYVPNPIRVSVGQTVTWTNKDHEPHDVTSFAGGFSSGPIAYGTHYRWRATKPGTFHYFCTLHPDMHGVVIVHAKG